MLCADLFFTQDLFVSMSVRLEIENQAPTAPCSSPPPRVLQATMPAELEPYMTHPAWEEFKSQVNQDLGILNRVLERARFIRLAILSLPLGLLLVTMVSVATSNVGASSEPSRYNDDEPGFSNYYMLMVPFIVGILVFFVLNMVFNRWFAGKVQASLGALRITCNRVSQDCPGLTMHLRDEVEGYNQRGRKATRMYHIEASIAGGSMAAPGVVAVAVPAHVIGTPVMATGAAGQNVPNFCPRCGTATNRNAFCSNCGTNLAAP